MVNGKCADSLPRFLPGHSDGAAFLGLCCQILIEKGRAFDSRVCGCHRVFLPCCVPATAGVQLDRFCTVRVTRCRVCAWVRFVRAVPGFVRKGEYAAGGGLLTTLAQVFVGNLPPEAEARDLRDFFRDFGQINDAWVARKPPGFGFVWFEDERDAVSTCCPRLLPPRHSPRALPPAPPHSRPP